MAIKEVILPKLGQTMEFGTIVEWLKQEGDPVQRVLAGSAASRQYHSQQNRDLLRGTFARGSRPRGGLRHDQRTGAPYHNALFAPSPPEGKEPKKNKKDNEGYFGDNPEIGNLFS